MIDLQNVSRTYVVGRREVAAVRDVTLAVPAGSFTAIVGTSGSGKSTLLTMAGGLQDPDVGHVVVAGERLDELSESERYRHRRQHVGFVFQDLNLVQVLTAVENVALPAELDGVPRGRAHRDATAALAAVGLADLGDRYPATLSGGQQQRVALARATCGEQRVILADEPTGALDSVTAAGVLDLLENLVARGSTCVVVTHDDDVAARADQVHRMQDGRFVTEAGS